MWSRVAVLAVLAGCGGGELAPDAALLDAPAASDATPDAWPFGCDGRRLVERPVIALTLIDAEPQIADSVVRLAATVDQEPCDTLAWMQTSYAFEAPAGSVTAYVFESLDRNACKDIGPHDRERPVIFSAYSDDAAWTFTSSAGASLTVDVALGPARACDPGRPVCEKDCDCAGVDDGERCVGAPGGGTVCAKPCELSRECAGGTCNHPDSARFDPASPRYVCIDEPECGAGVGCPPGFQCEDSVCTSATTLDPETRHPCTCQADCGGGTWCVQSDLPGGTARCELLCTSYDEGICPDGTMCAGRGVDADELAETSSICVPFEEVPI